ncbi:AMP-dependent synthetase and ligase, partial [Mesorhizobium sp. M00.F.Ca.ET.186.01.1.1]
MNPFANNSQIAQQLAKCEQLIAQLIQQTQQASVQYQQLLQQEQKNAMALEQIAQREHQAAHMIQTALQGHDIAIQQMQQIANICRQAGLSVHQPVSNVPLSLQQQTQGYASQP